jgi:hypothetical protein
MLGKLLAACVDQNVGVDREQSASTFHDLEEVVAIVEPDPWAESATLGSPLQAVAPRAGGPVLEQSAQSVLENRAQGPAFVGGSLLGQTEQLVVQVYSRPHALKLAKMCRDGRP